MFLKIIVHYAPRTQNVSFSASVSFGAEHSEAAKTRTRGNVTLCVRGSIYYFLSEGRKMNFRVPYRSHEILNVLHCFTLCISRPLYGPQKFILRPEDNNSTLYTKDAKCIILGECDLWGRAERGRQRSHSEECYRLRPW